MTMRAKITEARIHAGAWALDAAMLKQSGLSDREIAEAQARKDEPSPLNLRTAWIVLTAAEAVGRN